MSMYHERSPPAADSAGTQPDSNRLAKLRTTGRGLVIITLLRRIAMLLNQAAGRRPQTNSSGYAAWTVNRSPVPPPRYWDAAPPA